MRRIFKPGSISSEATFVLLVKEERDLNHRNTVPLRAQADAEITLNRRDAEDTEENAEFLKWEQGLLINGRYCELEREQMGAGQQYPLPAPFARVQQGHYKNLCVSSVSSASSVVNNKTGRAER